MTKSEKIQQISELIDGSQVVASSTGIDPVALKKILKVLPMELLDKIFAILTAEIKLKNNE